MNSIYRTCGVDFRDLFKTIAVSLTYTPLPSRRWQRKKPTPHETPEINIIIGRRGWYPRAPFLSYPSSRKARRDRLCTHSMDKLSLHNPFRALAVAICLLSAIVSSQTVSLLTFCSIQFVPPNMRQPSNFCRTLVPQARQRRTSPPTRARS